jgi:DNA topoisomerase IA
MKENGIGRPSTRANIIETLFRRQYIIRKQVLPTQTGIQLIDTIQNELVKSRTYWIMGKAIKRHRERNVHRSIIHQ